jgi:hypothetical protein
VAEELQENVSETLSVYVIVGELVREALMDWVTEGLSETEWLDDTEAVPVALNESEREKDCEGLKDGDVVSDSDIVRVREDEAVTVPDRVPEMVLDGLEDFVVDRVVETECDGEKVPLRDAVWESETVVEVVVEDEFEID